MIARDKTRKRYKKNKETGLYEDKEEERWEAVDGDGGEDRQGEVLEEEEEEEFGDDAWGFQFKDVHTREPLVAWRGKVYACAWERVLGTDIHLARKEDGVHNTTPAMELKDWDILGCSGLRLVGREVEFEPKDDMAQLGDDYVSFEDELRHLMRKKGEVRLVDQMAEEENAEPRYALPFLKDRSDIRGPLRMEADGRKRGPLAKELVEMRRGMNKMRETGSVDGEDEDVQNEDMEELVDEEGQPIDIDADGLPVDDDDFLEDEDDDEMFDEDDDGLSSEPYSSDSFGANGDDVSSAEAAAEDEHEGEPVLLHHLQETDDDQHRHDEVERETEEDERAVADVRGRDRDPHGGGFDMNTRSGPQQIFESGGTQQTHERESSISAQNGESSLLMAVDAAMARRLNGSSHSPEQHDSQ